MEKTNVHKKKTPNKAQDYTRRITPLRDLESHDEPLGGRSFRIYRLERELGFQKGEVVRHKEIIRVLRGALEEQRDMWALGLDANEWPTIGQVHRLINRLNSALDYKGPSFTDSGKGDT